MSRKSLFILTVCFLLAYGSAVQAGYIDNGDGTVTDKGTGLMWQQDTAPGTYTWDEAFAYCDNSTLAGYSDWRLPTVKELSSLIKHSILLPEPRINPTYFPDTAKNAYWTSDIYAENFEAAWLVFFSGGYSGTLFKVLKYNVRAVRGNELKNKFIDNGDGTITDNSTGLIWQKEFQKTTYTWKQARIYCRSLFLGRHFGWRLPTYNELLSIVSYDRTRPAIDTQYFPDTDDHFWTSTVDILPEYLFFSVSTINFDRGASGPDFASDMNYVRAVRAGRCGPLAFCPAKKVLGTDNPKLDSLRTFRDSTLANSAIGLKVIEIYYSNADIINAALERSPTLRFMTRKVFEIIALMVGRQEE